MNRLFCSGSLVEANVSFNCNNHANSHVKFTSELCPFSLFTKTDQKLADQTHARTDSLGTHKNEIEELIAVFSMLSKIHCKWTKYHSNFEIIIFVVVEFLTNENNLLARRISCTSWISDSTELRMQTTILHSPSVFTEHTEFIRLEWIAEIGISLCVYYDDNALLFTSWLLVTASIV